MSKLHFTTKHVKASDVKRRWFLVDATNQNVGRLCAKIASILRGKNKPYFSNHVDCGDYIVVINASKVMFSGNKANDKIYINFSGYPGGKKEESAKSLLARHPEMVIERAVKGMLPKNRLGRQMFKKLFVYSDDKHQQTTNKPSLITF